MCNKTENIELNVSQKNDEQSEKILDTNTINIEEEQTIVTENIQISNKEEVIIIPQIKEPEYIYLKSSSHWHSQYEAVVGLSHRKSEDPMPCQDSAFAGTQNRPIVITADGAGSSVVSDIGSQTVVEGISRLFYTLEKQVAELLDVKHFDYQLHEEFTLMVINHAKGLLIDLSKKHRRPLQDFRCTLLIGVIGTVHAMWIKVGDGALVIEKMKKQDDTVEAELLALGEVGKGEFANFTRFIDDKLQDKEVQFEIMSSENITALFAMSDGAAEKLVSSNGKRVAARLSTWAEELRKNKLKRHHLTTAFYDERFRKMHSGDDCSIAIVSAELLE